MTGRGGPGRGRIGRTGRVERGLDRELENAPSVGPSERAALRAQAHAVDLAESAADPVAVSTASAVYLSLRKAAGLTGAGGDGPADEFAAIVARLSAPSVGDAPPR